ncbi:hypothetical protein SE17_03185 [Kouleothrix aurantiaca]|uniref:Right handed beta helix domain-containing protein n=1 Tax=Kouleothrix aurantiaca TaxID=186479 RepID=A0A0P9DM12_9CHLR|nr:hypothetical protein SE17_03185 [Kouleothrix aurantiaca]
MIHSRRTLAWSLILALLCASMAIAQRPPTAHAAALTYVVDLATDAGIGATPVCDTETADDCTLRQAILKANSDGVSSAITFGIPEDDTDPNYGYNGSTGRWTITPASALPPVSGSETTINGLNNNAVGTPRMVIDGSGLSGGGVGLRLNSANNIVQNLIIVGFTGSNTAGIGIRIDGSSSANNQVYGNYIGNFPGGGTQPNTYAGIQIDNQAHDNTIGLSSNPGERNVIAGNTGDGIRLQNAPNNKIYGNYIGLGLGASFVTTPMPNSLNGITVVDSSGTQIGSMTASQRNVVSGNTGNGVELTGDGSTNNTVAGNYIGTNEIGSTDQGNGGSGVRIASGASNNNVFGSAGANSLISGNGGYGVLITDDSSTGNKIYNTYIGTNAGGTVARPNDLGGVFVRDNASNNQIGIAGQGNTIAGNKGYGVAFGRSTVGYTAISGNIVASNRIGLTPLATAVLSNTLGGILVGDGTTNTQLGVAGAGNQIAGNGGPGITISGSGVFSATISSNTIGLRRAASNGPFTTAAGNNGDGILINNDAHDILIGTSADSANTIAGNKGNGIHVSGNKAKLVSIKQNYIGVAFSSNAYVALPNTQNGVLADGGAQQVTIQNNHISHNALKGIALSPNAPAPGGSSTNANHDIDPPVGIRLNQNGQLTGRVTKTGTSDACVLPCTIQLFTTDPAALDGQGRDFVSQQITSNGYFTFTLGSLPPQLALTATDKDGNTSEFSGLDTQIGPIDLQDANPSTQNAIPGQVVTYTHELVNNGTVDLLDLKLSAVSSRKWPIKTVPALGNVFSLAAGETKLITLTLTLPFGHDPRVLAGPPPDLTALTVRSTRFVTVTDTVTDTTNVLPKFDLVVTPLEREGFGAPDSSSNIVRYVHKLVNKGNVTQTVQVQTRSVRNWLTEVSTDTITLAPGDDNAKFLTVSVTVPSGTQAGTTETTFIDLIVPSDPGESQTLTDTTHAELTPSALLLHDGDIDGEAGAGQKATFFYIVENRSNGPATFSLEGSGALGSDVTFRRTDGGSFGANYSFTVGNTPGENTVRFAMEVTLNPNLIIGNTETVTVLLLDFDQRIRQAAQNRIVINANAMAPRQYIPIATN